ncbi:hypothetical protein D3C76_1226860 [compost metagenome]
MQMASKPVIAHNQRSSSSIISPYPAACSFGTNGCRLANCGQVIGIISLVALSFMVQEPSGIID